MNDRSEQAREFIRNAGWQDATRTMLAGDASNRRYDRLELPGGRRAVLMDAPPEKGEDIRPFVQIATILTGAGLSAPKIFEQDAQRGFLLLEDLGDDLFVRVMSRDPASERPLYAAAVDVLSTLHAIHPPDLVRYDANRCTNLAALAFDWYLPGATGQVYENAKADFCAAFEPMLAPLDTVPGVLTQRDYHAENLLWLPDRSGPQRVGLLDFQDAMLGHPAYDLVSVLQDARRDVPLRMESEMVDRFLSATSRDQDKFHAAYAILGLQRNLRILGVFARLCLRDGKAHYVDLIPRVWGHVQTNLRHPVTTPIAKILKRTLPPPTPDNLERIKSRCATFPKP